MEPGGTTIDTSAEKMHEHLGGDAFLEYKKAFDMFDPERSGLISIKDLCTICNNMGRDISDKEVRGLLRDITDKDDLRRRRDGSVEFQEFIAIMSVIITSSIPEDEMHMVFSQFDLDGDGYIEPEDLRELLSRLGDDITEEDLDAMIKEADQDGDGKVSYKEFVQVMTNSADHEMIEQHSLDVIPKEKALSPEESFPNQSDFDNEALIQSEPSFGGSYSKESEEDSSHQKKCERLTKRRMSCIPGISGRKKTNSIFKSRSYSSLSNLGRKSCPNILSPTPESPKNRAAKIRKKGLGERFRFSAGAVYLKLKGKKK